MNRDIAQHYEDLWTRFLLAVHTFSATVCGIREEDHASTPDGEICLGAFTAYEPHKADDQIQSAATKMVQGLVRAAEREFAPEGGTLDIDPAVYVKRFEEPIIKGRRRNEPKDWTPFSPLKVWEALEADYGGSKGVEAGYRQAADTLIRFFGICQNEAVTRRAGRVLLSHRVYMDSIFGGLHYNVARDIHAAVSAFGAFAEWAGIPDLGLTARLVSDVHGGRTGARAEVTSRAKYTEGPSLEVVTYLTRFEYRFSTAAAEKLHVFVATYGDLERDAA